MANYLDTKSILAALAVGALALGLAGEAEAADKFKVTSVDCEMFFVWKRTPVIHYDIVDEHKPDYNSSPPADYFRQAAMRTAAYCDRSSSRPESPMAPPRKIRGIWFESNDGQFKLLFDIDRGDIDLSAGIVNAFGDRYGAKQRLAAQYAARLEELKTRDARAQELKATAERIAQDKIVAENAREKLFFDSPDVQVSRLGTTVAPANFATVQDVRNNPFHWRKLGLVVVPTRFNRMVNEKLAQFGTDFAPVFVSIEDVDRFAHGGETVMLAFRVRERGEVERSFGSLPEIVISALKAEPIFGEYVGAYTCPGTGCMHLFDAPPPRT